MNKDIELAIDNLRRAAGRYSRSERYYKGDHDLSFATEIGARASLPASGRLAGWKPAVRLERGVFEKKK